MKLASLRDGTRDGRLVVVSDDLETCREAPITTLQEALDDWATAELILRATVPDAGPFDPNLALSPLPRAYQWLDGSAYVNHVELVRRARGAEMPESFWTDPLMYQGVSDGFLAPTAPFPSRSEWGTDFEAEVAVIVDHVPMGATPKVAAASIRLVMLCNDVSLRGLIPHEVSKGFGFVNSKPASSFSPVAVTPDALPGWDGSKLSGVMKVNLNETAFGRVEASHDMTFDFPALIAHAAKTRALGAGTIIGSGTVSNKQQGGPGKPVSQGGAGYSCIAEQRMVETILSGAVTTPFLIAGDRVTIWMDDDHGHPIFGRIDQTVELLKD